MKKPIFEIKNLVYTNNKINVLSIKKFEIHRSACYLFNGNMASGKTLLLDILSKDVLNYGGNIEFEGEDFKEMRKSEYKTEIMYVKQNFKAPYFKTVKSYIYSQINKRFTYVWNRKTIFNSVSKFWLSTY